MMPPIILTVLQGLVLLLLYVFIARAVRAVLRDVSPGQGGPRPRQAPASRPAEARQRQPAGAVAAQGASAKRSDPSARVTPREIVVHSESGAPRVMPLDSQEITFGRGDQSTVTLTDPYTSDRHARIYYDGQRWLVADLGSTNGTFLNQVKVGEPTPIAAGDQLGIGRTVVEVRK